MNKKKKQVRKKRVLIISALGIGNVLLAEPMVRHLKQKMPAAELFLVTGASGTEDLLPRSVKFAGQLSIPIREMQTEGLSLKYLFTLFVELTRLRRMNFDISIVTMPSNHILWNVAAFYIGAKIRIIHEYPNKRHASLFFLHNKRVVLRQELHDIQQNLNLLIPLKISIPHHKERMRLTLKKREMEYAKKYLARYDLLNPSIRIVAFHVGCDPDAPRRWMLERYAELITIILKNYDDVRIILNAGPAEIGDSNAIAGMLSHLVNPPLVITPPSIFHAAAILKCCTLLISNDSGVMHVGTGVGVPVLSLFGPSDNIRMAPYQNQNNVVYADEQCRPCTTTLSNIGEKFFCCKNRLDCWKNLTVDKVFERVVRYLEP